MIFEILTVDIILLKNSLVMIILFVYMFNNKNIITSFLTIEETTKKSIYKMVVILRTGKQRIHNIVLNIST